MNIKGLMAITFLCISFSLVKAQQSDMLFVKIERLFTVKERMFSGDLVAVKWKNSLIKDGDNLLSIKPGSVMDKQQNPPSSSKHDYMSLAPYYWPDSSKPGSIPYIRKDGERNPEVHLITDHAKADQLEKAVQTLAIAYYYSGEEKYAKKASQFLHVWFLDSTTKMNPNLQFAQAIKGVNDGRGTGLIETIGFSTILNVVGLLDGSKYWTKEDKIQLKQWFSDYLNWMLESANGKAERKAKNNHGIWYDMQILSIELYLGKKEMAKEFVTTTINRIANQIEPDGRMPLELTRTAALSYSTFCLEAWFKTATLADNIGVDLWHYTTSDGRSIKKAIDWLLPYALGEKKWEYKQIHDYSKKQLYYILLVAADKYQDSHYYNLAMTLKNKESNKIVEIFYDK